MPNTAIVFDVVRTEMTEARFTLYRKAVDITAPAQKNNVYQWPGTGSYTLQPLNLTTDFSETGHWEPLKFRLADCNYNADWWAEAPDNTNPEKGGPSDYFFHGVVKNVNWNPSGKRGLLDLLVDIAGNAVVFSVNLEQRNSVLAMTSKAEQPANQGYCLRFRVDGRETARRAAILEFYFGQFMLRLNTYGDAQLWQSTDFVNYAYVYSWRWANTDQIHGRSHTITIFPHCRNKIEFLASTGNKEIAALGNIHIRLKGKAFTGHGLYEIPGEISFQADEKTPLITRARPWGIAVSREYRPKFQVSRLGFANGTNRTGYFWDTATDITSRTGVVYPPALPLFSSAEFDANGGAVVWALRDADTGAEPFVSDGTATKAQFGFGMQGKGDLPGPGLGSTITPEFYGYGIDKAPGYFTYQRTPYTCPGTLFRLDRGKHPEEERSSFSTYDRGAYLRFSERGDIPVEIGDLDSDLLFFEGNVHQMEAGEAPAQTAVGLHAEARGMVDNFLRMDWSEASPDFARDPYDAEHRPYLFAEAIYVCFEAAGYPRQDVVIEEVDLWLKNFRIWSRETGGRSREGGIGHGHKSGATRQSPWQPVGGHKVYQFTDHIIREVLGWNWVRDRTDRKWHVYKRPDPQVDSDAEKLVPKVEFYSDGHPAVGWNGQAIPAYKHSDLKKSVKRPICTTIIASALMDRGKIETPVDLSDALDGASDPDVDSPVDADFSGGARKIYQTLTNKFGYVNPSNPNPDTNNPDFLGRQRIRVHHFAAAESYPALAWQCRRLFEDNCFGYLNRTLESDWGDLYTYNLRKWDMVLVNGVRHYVDRIEPTWSDKKPRRAHYTLTKYRPETRAPR